MAKKILKIEDLRGGTYNQTIKRIVKLESGVKKIVVRKESKFLNESLINEIEFLLALSAEAKSHFPQIEKYQIDKLPVFYEMPNYDFKTMRQNIMQENVNSEYCIKAIKNILDFMFSKVFSQNMGVNSPDNLIKHTFLRARERQKQLCSRSSILKRFVKAENIIIGGKEYRNLPMLFEWLLKKQDIIKKLTPKITHMIHGDFHFDNFLVDNKNPDKFILLDPRGEKRGYDYAYDLGKLWHSFHGLYDFIHEGLFEMEYKANGGIIEVDVFKPKKSEAFGVYQGIYSRRKEFIDMCVQHMKEDNAELQILFNEAIHFCALAPFHLKNDGVEKEPICRYIMGVKLLNEFIDGLK